MRNGTMLPVGERKKVSARIREQRRRMNSFSQGPMRKYTKLQGPVCKTKFPFDLKSK
jgi:hypothetical protein